MRPHVSMLVASALALLATVTCYAPTEVTLDITTDVACADDPHGVIYRGSPALLGPEDDARTDPKRCDQRTSTFAALGTLVVVPSGDRDARAAVKLVFARKPAKLDDCIVNPEGADCIVARRAFSFLPHTSRRLPIHLSKDCFGIPCEENVSTCVGGKCVPIDVVCEGTDCDVKTDGGASPAPPPDADPPSDASPSGPCVGPQKNDVLASFEATPAKTAMTATHLYAVDASGQKITRIDKTTGVSVEKALPTAQLPPAVIETLSSDGAFAWFTFLRSAGPAAFQALAKFETEQPGHEYQLFNQDSVTTLLPLKTDFGNVFYYAQISKGSPSKASVRELKPGNTDQVIIPSTQLGAPTQIVVTPARVVLLEGTSAVFYDSSGAYLHAFGSSPVSSIVGEGSRVYIATSAELLEYAPPSQFSGLVTMTGIKGLQIDDKYFYWFDGGKVLRYPRPSTLPSGNPATQLQTVFAKPEVTAVDHVLVDPAATGCVYFWSRTTNFEKVALRVVAKP